MRGAPPLLHALQAAILCLVTACAGQPAQVATPVPPAAPEALPAVFLLPGYPLDTTNRPTTSGRVYRANLEALQAQLAARPDAQSAELLVARAGAAFEHYQAFGNLDELDRAAEWARSAAQTHPAPRGALLLWAQIAAYLHQFEAASEALDRLAKGEDGPTGPALAQLRGQISAALGRQDAVDRTAPITLASSADAVAMAERCVQLGDLNCASEAYHQAQFLSTDSSPVLLAWLHTQQGIALLRFGHVQEAARFFRASLQRLPDYYVATEHLAECLTLSGAYVEADALYAQVIAQTGNPEFMAGYAAMHRAAGRLEASQHWQQRASERYSQLLQAHPATYAQHAVHFYLDSGDSERALALATTNIGIRQDVGSWILLAQARHASGDGSGACAALQSAIQTGWRPPELTALRGELGHCGPSGGFSTPSPRG